MLLQRNGILIRIFLIITTLSLRACEWYSLARTRGTPAIEITAVTSSGHVTSSVTSPIDSARPLSYRLPTVNNPLSLSAVVSEIFGVKNGHGPTDTHVVPNATQVLVGAYARGPAVSTRTKCWRATRRIF